MAWWERFWAGHGTPPTVPNAGPVRFHCPHCKVPVGDRDLTCPECGSDLLG